MTVKERLYGWLKFDSLKMFCTSRPVVGLTANVSLNNSPVIVAKVDTGANRSSIDYELANNLNLKAAKKKVKVTNAHGTTERQLVLIKICRINDVVLKNVKFNISNRTKLETKILIGEDILKSGNFIIDPTL